MTSHPRHFTWQRLAPSLSLFLAAGVCALLPLTARPDPQRVQELEDGSKIALTRISFNNTNLFTHGSDLERLLGNLVPKAGFTLGTLQLQRPTLEQFPLDQGHGLIVEFKRLSTNAPGLQPLALRPPRTVRCLIVGDDGSEYYGTDPTDREVTISLQVQSNAVGQSSWRVFSLRLEDALGNVRDRGHPFRPTSDHLTQDDRLFLDPRKTWKFEADLAQVAELPASAAASFRDGQTVITAGLDPQCVYTIRVPRNIAGAFLTNVHAVPLQITPLGGGGISNGKKFLSFQVQIIDDHSGRRILNLAGNQRILQHEPLYPGSNRPVYFTVPDNGTSTGIELTFALVKNYHVEFYVQPKLTGFPPAPPGNGLKH